MLFSSLVTMHFIELIVTYALSECKHIVRLKGKYKVRFEVVWIQEKGCLLKKKKMVIHTADTPAVELWYEARKGKPEPAEPGAIVKLTWKKCLGASY